MASRRRPLFRWVVLALVAVLLAALLVWALLRPGADDQAQDQQPARPVQPISAISARMLPPLDQVGARPASADKAAAFVQVDATSKVTGSAAQVTLQVRRDGAWDDEATAPLDADGRATFPSPVPDGDTTPLRVVAAKDPAVRSEQLSPDAWKTTFDDEFTGTELDATKWSYRQLGQRLATSGRTKSASSADAVSVGNGSARLSVLPDPADEGYYLNGHISTEQTYTFTYGVAASRIKFQKERGAHGSFWMQSPLYGSVPGDAKKSGGEIDAVEYFGSTYPKGGLASFAYYKDAQSEVVRQGDVLPDAAKALGENDAFWKKYHVFSVEWTPKSYIFRVDGVETLRLTRGISGAPEFLVLSLLSSDWELPNLDDSQLPATMKVDWVRVWQQSS